MQSSNISVVITCKGRLHHIQQTLPLLVVQSHAEIIVVDYMCPNNTGDWIAMHYPTVIVIRVGDDEGFCAARARNFGAKVARFPWILFVDADIKVSASLFEWMKVNLEKHFFYRAGKVDGSRKRDTWGTFICSQKAFEAVSGYDEVFRGWGGEDDDIYRRLSYMGFVESEYPGEYVTPIPHDDLERLAFYDIKERRIHHFINWFYIEAKMYMMMIHGRRKQPPLQARLDIMHKVTTTIFGWVAGKTQYFPGISFSVSRLSWLPEPYKMRKEINFTLTMEVNSDDDIAP
jgi:glycosyltransferase involved in cell wall biosynthesis